MSEEERKLTAHYKEGLILLRKVRDELTTISAESTSSSKQQLTDVHNIEHADYLSDKYKTLVEQGLVDSARRLHRIKKMTEDSLANLAHFSEIFSPEFSGERFKEAVESGVAFNKLPTVKND